MKSQRAWLREYLGRSMSNKALQISARTLAERDYIENVKLIHKLTNKFMNRVIASGAGVERDDIFQEVSRVWVKCKGGYKEDSGVKFTSYFFSAAHKEMNRFLKKDWNQTRELGLVSTSQESNDGSEIDILETTVVESDISPEEILERQENVSVAISALSEEAKLVLSWIVSPPEELKREAKMRMTRDRSGAKSEGLNMRSTLIFAVRVVGMSEAAAYRVRGELMNVIKEV